jgi:hypothetical protein
MIVSYSRSNAGTRAAIVAITASRCTIDPPARREAAHIRRCFNALASIGVS